MNFAEKCVKKNLIYKGKIVDFYCDDAILPNGNPCIREYVSHCGGACVVFVKGDSVLLVKQFRYPYGEELLELPAGKLNQGENPELCAFRELEEETGYIPDKLTLLHVMYPSPGYTNEKIYIYLAEKVKDGNVHLDDDEFLNSLFIPLDKVVEMIAGGEIKDAKTIIGIQSYILSHKK